MTSTTTPYGSYAQPAPQPRPAPHPTPWSSVTPTTGSAKSAAGANDWSSYRMALPSAYAGALAGYASGSSKPYDIYRLTAHVNVDLLNFLHSNEESFEARLMAGGYVGYGSSLGARTLPTAAMYPPISAPSTSYHAPQPYVPLYPPPDERTMRKRRRLDAFRRTTPPKPGNLRPVTVEGRGRMLMDFAEENEILQRLAQRNPTNEPADPPRQAPSERLAWPDEQFPWNLRNHERIQSDRAKREHELRCIERFLDEASDEEEEEEPDEVVFREAGYYSVIERSPEPSLKLDVEGSSGTATPSWTSTARSAQPERPITSRNLTASTRNPRRTVRTDTMQRSAQRALQRPGVDLGY
ncbi:unnamed protein product [Peniophora sp. CBMAI 1063]|nr:unnamed protein product [Peniophora sp. CBMAI 1063]